MIPVSVKVIVFFHVAADLVSKRVGRAVGIAEEKLEVAKSFSPPIFMSLYDLPER